MLNKEQVMEIIPHRDPFLLIDGITELEIGKKAVGYKDVTENEYYFKGHFPGNPVMPGVIIVESLAQVGAVSVLSMDAYKGKTAYFGGIDNCRFRRMVKPGDKLILEVTLTKLRGIIGKGQAVATVDGEVACECEITFIIPKE